MPRTWKNIGFFACFWFWVVICVGLLEVFQEPWRGICEFAKAKRERFVFHFENVAGWICWLVANLKCNIINHPKGSFIYYHILSMTFHISSPLPSQAIGTHVHPCYYTIRGYYTGIPPCVLSPRILATYIVFHYVSRCMNICIISTYIYIYIHSLATQCVSSKDMHNFTHIIYHISSLCAYIWCIYIFLPIPSFFFPVVF